MNEDRFAGLFSDKRRDVVAKPDHVNLRGFITNPLAASVTPAQALMYQAAYEQAQKDNQEPEWPDAECWN
jgi:hypothetical protein